MPQPLASARLDRDAPPLRQAAVERSLTSRYEGAETEVARLLDAAYRLIRQGGTVELSLRDLLTEAGLANRSFYRHFATKDDFMLVLIEDLQGQLTAFLTERMAREATPVGRVRTWVLGVLDQAADTDAAALGRPFLVHGARLRESVPEVYRTTGTAMLDLLTTAIAQAVEAGELHSDDPRADARAVFHLAMSVMQSHVLDRTVPTQAERDAVLGFALRALR